MKTSSRPVPFKTAKTIKPYTVNVQGYDMTVPAGARVNNSTACGNDDSYHFWADWSEQAQALTGFKDSSLAHHLRYYGLNVPSEYCEPYATA